MNEETIAYIRQLADRQFFGDLSLKFQRGNVIHLRQEENLRPNELPTAAPNAAAMPGQSGGKYDAQQRSQQR